MGGLGSPYVALGVSSVFLRSFRLCLVPSYLDPSVGGEVDWINASYLESLRVACKLALAD